MAPIKPKKIKDDACECASTQKAKKMSVEELAKVKAIEAKRIAVATEASAKAKVERTKAEAALKKAGEIK